MQSIQLFKSLTARRGLRLLSLACLLAACNVQADVVRFGGTGSAIGTMKRLEQAYQRVDPSFQIDFVPNLGSSGGVKALLKGHIQLAAVSRPLQSDEVAAGVRAIEYGRTAFVIATSKPGIKGISTDEIADLYAGRKAHWPDGQPVRVVLRPLRDGDTALLASFSPAIQAALEQAFRREGMVTGMTDQEAVDAVESLPGGLGTASMALLLSEQRRAQPLSINGVEPTQANVTSGRYPYFKTMYFAVLGNASPAVMKFIEFVGSDAGRHVLSETGHIPMAAPRPAQR